MGVYADWKTVPSFVNTLLLKGLGDMFSNPQKGVFESFTEMRKSGSNLNNLTLAGGTQGMRRWRGSKVFNQIKAFSLNVETGNWESSLIIDKDTLRYDQTGEVARRVASFLADQIDFYDTASLAALVSVSGAGATCIDGTALFNASHPWATAAGGTQSNLGTTAYSMAQQDAICIIMGDYTHEDKRLNVNPDTIMCGRKILRKVLEANESPVRVIPLNASGVEAYSSAIMSSVIPNVYPGGKLTVVFNPRLTGTYDDYYYIYDSKFAGGKPILGIEAEAPHLVALDKEDGYYRFMNNQYIWSVEANVDFFPYNPLCCYATVL